MKTCEELIQKDLDWHAKQDPADHAVSPEFQEGFLAGMRQAMLHVARTPDWEEVCERLMDALMIYGEVFDSMPASIEDMIGDDDKNARVDDAFGAYKSAHFRTSSE